MSFSKPPHSVHPLKALFSFFSALVFVLAFGASAQANSKYAAIVIDANTGKTLHSSAADSQRYPASLTKMMTLYLLFEAMHQGKVNKNTRITFSQHAASMQPSKLGVPAGKSITAETAILALVTKSANDVAAAVGEYLGGTESNFAQMMTNKARQLGMSRTTFRNASGLPNSRQMTTARDMATLGLALQEHFPNEFKYFSTPSFKYGRSRMPNHNRLLGRVDGVDGIKTGYTRASGFNLVTSVHRGNRAIVAVVMGGQTGASRNAQMQKLIETYIGKASTRSKGALVARNGSTSFSAGSADTSDLALADVPLPTMRPSAPAAATPTVATAYAAAPAARPTEALDTIQTGSIPTRSGWVIQIASLPSQEEADSFLRNAQDRAGAVLGQRDPFIERFEKGGSVYHRARFAGFGSKSEAWAACKALKKYNYSCLAFDGS